MQALININLDNEAFQDNEAQELARVLRFLADDIVKGVAGDYKPLRDLNGNRVGKFVIED